MSTEAVETWLANRKVSETDWLLTRHETIGDYIVEGCLGRGGSGEVYCVVHRELGTRAALKLLHRDDVEGRRRFASEAKFLAAHKSALFPAFMAYGEHKGRPYLIEEFLEDRELPSTDAGVARLIIDLCAVVADVHRCGFVHRDIKPGNVLFRSGRPVIADFGLVAPVGSHESPAGSPSYAAPEQAVGEAIAPAMDIHALGMVADECFHHHPPRTWDWIIRRATSRVAERRYKDVEALVRAVRRRNWLRNLVVALGVMSVTFVVTLWGLKLVRENRRLAEIEQAEQVAATKAAEALRREQDDYVRDFRLMLMKARRTWRDEVEQARGPKETGCTIPIALPKLCRGSNMSTYIREEERVKLEEETDRLYSQILADAEAGKCNYPVKADYPSPRH